MSQDGPNKPPLERQRAVIFSHDRDCRVTPGGPQPPQQTAAPPKNQEPEKKSKNPFSRFMKK